MNETSQIKNSKSTMKALKAIDGSRKIMLKGSEQQELQVQKKKRKEEKIEKESKILPIQTSNIHDEGTIILKKFFDLAVLLTFY